MLKIIGINIPINNLTLSRIPIFVIGVIAGLYGLRGSTIPRYASIFMEFISITGIIIMIYVVSIYSHEFLWAKMIYWLPFILVTPGFCLILSRIINILPKSVSGVLKFIGGISLEIYLTHMLFIKQYVRFIKESDAIHSSALNWISGIGFVIFSIVCGYILSIVLKSVMSRLNCVKSRIKLKTIN